MRSAILFPATLAFCTSLASAATVCSSDIKITEPTPKIDCEVVDANVVVDSSVSGSLSIEGPKQFKKDFTINNATKLLSISSSSVNSVGGTLKLEGLQLLSSLNLQALKSVKNLELMNLPQLSGLTFGTLGVTKANTIKVADTFINDLSGLNIATVDTFEITNNAKLTTFNSDLVNITKSLKITNNGNNMLVNMSSLRMAGDMQFRQVKSIDAPVLEQVESIKVNDSPELLSVKADNLTTISASLTLINNRKLANVSFAALETIKGDITIQNNTALMAIAGFPKLATVGNVIVRGSMEQVELPSLKDVKGSVTVTSTTDISDFCKFFDDLKAKGDIQGKESCTSNNTRANEGTGDNGSSRSDSSSQDAAGIINVDVAILALALFAGIAQLL